MYNIQWFRRKIKVMKPEEDAFGQEIWAYHKGRECFEVIERDDGYFDADNLPKMYFSEYENWSLREKMAMEFVKGRVLDVGCGAGRHSLYLQNKGFDILGIDNSPLAIEVCKLRGLKKAKVMSIEEVNFKPSSFDTIIMMGNNFGLFGSFKKARRLLKRFHKMTSENALIIAETRDPYKTDNPAHLKYHEFNKKRERMGGQVRIRVRFEKYATKWFDYLFVSKEEMEKILKGTGWKIKKFIDSESPQYIAIIEKSNKQILFLRSNQLLCPRFFNALIGISANYGHGNALICLTNDQFSG
jgi:SAM-dependent methyltransferase